MKIIFIIWCFCRYDFLTFWKKSSPPLTRPSVAAAEKNETFQEKYNISVHLRWHDQKFISTNFSTWPWEEKMSIQFKPVFPPIHISADTSLLHYFQTFGKKLCDPYNHINNASMKCIFPSKPHEMRKHSRHNLRILFSFEIFENIWFRLKKHHSRHDVFITSHKWIIYIRDNLGVVSRPQNQTLTKTTTNRQLYRMSKYHRSNIV